jgi:hypothetical protein
MSEQIRIESGSRWDTLELVDRLPRCRWYLVERRSGAWDLHLEARSPALLAQLLEATEAWARDRHVDSVVHLSRRDIRVPGRHDGSVLVDHGAAAASA